ncbi:MAG: two-component sensor histidine kinase [Frankiales bacterium]|nr:two-component sensor histidine kinase [Frankiales bacterium]
MMIIRRSAEAHPQRRVDRLVGRTIAALVSTSLLAFALVGAGAAKVASDIARGNALAEAVRSANVVSRTAFAPLIPALLRHDPKAIVMLDNAVRSRSRDGAILRIKVWLRNGTIVYSDEHSAIGARFPSQSEVLNTVDTQVARASLSNLDDPENATESTLFDRLVEVYVPMNLDDGTKLVFEMYSSDRRVITAEHELQSKLVPFALLALLILLVTQLPISVWLIRRLGRAQSERSRLMRSALAASDRERRRVARDLHDGVVQDLASAGYAMGALSRTLPSDAAAGSRDLADTVGSVVQRAISSLRTLIVDIYPPDLNAVGLNAAVQDLAAKLQMNSGVDVAVEVSMTIEPPSEVSAMVYRCVRESLFNIAKHADARHAEIRLTAAPAAVRLRVHDDGVGMPVGGVDRHREGHVGLTLLRDAAADLGGTMVVRAEPGGGTTVLLDIPVSNTGQHDADPESSSADGRQPLPT